MGLVLHSGYPGPPRRTGLSLGAPTAPLRTTPQEAADPTLGVVLFLRKDPILAEATEGRIMRPELQEGEDALMPRATIIVRPAGGGALFGKGNLQVLDSRVDCICYGSTRLEAERIGREVTRTLKQMSAGLYGEPDEEGAPVKLYWARISGAASSAIEPDAEWPFALVSAQVMHSLNTINH